MKNPNVLVVAFVFGEVCAAPVSADYASIQHSVFNGVDDTHFDAATGVLSIHATTSNLLWLNDPTPLVGVVSNTVFDLQTTFDRFMSQGRAWFTGGTLALSFDFDDGGGAMSCHISGPIGFMRFEISQVGALSRIDGLGHWNATSWGLPGSNSWDQFQPDNPRPGFSGTDSLSIAFDDDLTDFNWDRDITGRVESQYSIFPGVPLSGPPEPATFGLLFFGMATVVWRRSRGR